MTETVRTAIIDKDGKDVLLTVRPTLADPTKNGLVICNPDGSKIGNPFDYIQLKTDVTPTGNEPVGTSYWDSTKDSPSFVSNGGIVNIKEYVDEQAFISSLIFG